MFERARLSFTIRPMTPHSRWLAKICAAVLMALAGCTNANIPLNAPHVGLESRRMNHTRAAMFTGAAPSDKSGPASSRRPAVLIPETQTARLPFDRDGMFVGLALSGGGSRSANFSAACMFQLERVGLLGRVDYISSVSGGSLPAAYYCATGDGWNPGNVQKKLTYPFASNVLVQTLLPWNHLALMFTDWDRSDLLAGTFRDVMFNSHGRALTFADLRPDRPRLLINSTDLQSGRRFVFSDETFDQLNSDLSKFPLSYAVAASAAVPVILHPVTLRDYSTTFPQYRHLIDGGVTDNLGIETLLETYSGQLAAAAREHRPDPYPNGAVLIVADAHTAFNAELSSMGDIGWLVSLKTALGLTSSSLLNRVSSADMADIIVRNTPDQTTAQQMRKEIRDLNETGYLDIRDRSGHRVRVIYLSLSQVNNLHNLPFQSFSESLNSIGTYFNISDYEAYHLYQAAELLVKEKFEGRLKEIVAELDQAAATRPALEP